MAQLGILVHGDNHFIVEGPPPDYQSARRLVWAWEVPQLNGPVAASDPALTPWRLVTRAFREDLTWAVVLESGTAVPQPAVEQLLAEVAARGIAIRRGAGPWLPNPGRYAE